MLKDYRVQLHNRQKRDKWMLITKCVSPAAACHVADLKEHMRIDRWNPYWASYAIEVSR